MKQVLFILCLFASLTTFAQGVKIVPAATSYSVCKSEFANKEAVRWNVTKTYQFAAPANYQNQTAYYTLSGLNQNGTEIFRTVLPGCSLTCYDGENMEFHYDGGTIELTERIKTNL